MADLSWGAGARRHGQPDTGGAAFEQPGPPRYQLAGASPAFLPDRRHQTEPDGAPADCGSTTCGASSRRLPGPSGRGGAAAYRPLPPSADGRLALPELHPAATRSQPLLERGHGADSGRLVEPQTQPRLKLRRLSDQTQPRLRPSPFWNVAMALMVADWSNLACCWLVDLAAEWRPPPATLRGLDDRHSILPVWRDAHCGPRSRPLPPARKAGDTRSYVLCTAER